MKSTSNYRQTFVAALLVLSMAGSGLQSSLVGIESNCACDETTSFQSDVASTSCCKFESVQKNSCCSDKQPMATSCRCNPIAAGCVCGECSCSEKDDSKSPLPALPTNETTELASPILIGCGSFVGYPGDPEIVGAGLPKSSAKLMALSSQQTCVLLSRFTC